MQTRDPHPHLALLLKQYARDLSESAPSPHLDARIDRLVAGQAGIFAPAPRVRRRPAFPYAAAAGFAALAIGAGVFIGMRLEQSRAVTTAAAAHDTLWPPADLTMWPTDSVSFKIPAEYSPQGTLVAVDPDSKHGGTRYWIDVVVSNDGTFRIQQIVPSDSTQKKGGRDGVKPAIR
jgi:hypothetical protein